jgi:hypothetical protein
MSHNLSSVCMTQSFGHLVRKVKVQSGVPAAIAVGVSEWPKSVVTFSQPWMNGQTQQTTEASVVESYRSFEQALDELNREANVRSRCFPRWIQEGRVSRSDARDRLDRICSAIKYLEVMSKSAGAEGMKVFEKQVTSSGDMTANAPA